MDDVLNQVQHEVKHKIKTTPSLTRDIISIKAFYSLVNSLYINFKPLILLSAVFGNSGNLPVSENTFKLYSSIYTLTNNVNTPSKKNNSAYKK